MEGRRGSWAMGGGGGGEEPGTVPAMDFKPQNLGPHLFTKRVRDRQ